MESLALLKPSDSRRQGNFKTKNCPPSKEEMKGFEEDIMNITQFNTFKRAQGHFQLNLQGDIGAVKTDVCSLKPPKPQTSTN